MKRKLSFPQRLQLLWHILKYTGADKFLLSFVIFVFLDALLIFLFDPSITSYGDALWYCYAVLSTAGFGDVVATTFLSRILSVLLTVYGVLVIAIITGVVVNFYTRLIDIKLEKDKDKGKSIVEKFNKGKTDK